MYKKHLFLKSKIFLGTILISADHYSLVEAAFSKTPAIEWALQIGLKP